MHLQSLHRHVPTAGNTTHKLKDSACGTWTRRRSDLELQVPTVSISYLNPLPRPEAC